MHALQLLEWQLEAGVDEAVGEIPVNRLAPPAFAHPAAEARGVSESAAPMLKGEEEGTRAMPKSFGAKLVAPAEAIAEARKLADRCTTLAELEAAVRGFDALSIKKTAMKTVFADGNPQAKIMLLGEAPGAQEDQEGIPFCGPSGKLLDKMLAAIGLTRDHVYITNTVFWRPPGNRQPSPEELATCQPFVQKHISLIAPRLLVALGGVATGALLEKNVSINRLRLKNYEYTNPYLPAPLPVAVTFHPSYLMRSPAQKRLAWQDLQFIREWLKSQDIDI